MKVGARFRRSGRQMRPSVALGSADERKWRRRMAVPKEIDHVLQIVGSLFDEALIVSIERIRLVATHPFEIIDDVCGTANSASRMVAEIPKEKIGSMKRCASPIQIKPLPQNPRT